MTKQNSVIEYSVLENNVREILDVEAPRRLGQQVTAPARVLRVLDRGADLQVAMPHLLERVQHEAGGTP